ncbi:MAG: MSMEG_0565 family glycosyltransferase [Thermoleophilia bacterium]|nr:MSMEG_0565 family glycosyltransferase [Thermoleophilia bacterium]
MRVRLLTYSTKPRGGVVHALRLAEELQARGHEVELWTIAAGGSSLYRETDVPVTGVAVPRIEHEDIGDRVARYAAAMAAGLREAPPVDVSHAEDCLSARALLALRAEGRIPAIVRTVHHVDVFESRFLEECQRASIQDVDLRVCVSRFWSERLREEFGVESEVVPNGVDAGRFAGGPMRAEAGRVMGWGDRPVVLAVGGIEPRKGSRTLLEAFARARGRLGAGALLVVAGGATLFDYREYRDGWRDDAARLGLRVSDGRRIPPDADVAVLGLMDDDEMPVLYRAADALAFPSTREGFGLVVLEAMAAGLPVVTSDLPVLQEFLTDGEDCLMCPVGDSGPLSAALVRAVRDDDLRAALRAGAGGTVARYGWDRTAEAHERIYEGFLACR